ncbi:MAG: FkbM family methyltransferase [Alphaproteobacteria bacterium]|nr:FkbM family methyltransferase [Alphaproteobacteria bacterium]
MGAEHYKRSNSVLQRIKSVVYKLPLGGYFINVVRKVFIILYMVAWRTARFYAQWRYRNERTRSFAFAGFSVTEPTSGAYMPGALVMGLRGHVRTAKQVQQLLREEKEPVILDVGANVGIFSLLYSRIPGAKVFSFEPVSQTYACLRENIGRNGIDHVETIQEGLSDTETTLYIGPEDETPKTTRFSVHVKHDGRGEEATFTTLDIFVARRGLDHLSFLKIDVQGHEMAVLKGGMESLKRFLPIIEVELVKGRENPENILIMLADLGYSFFTWNGRDLRSTTIDNWVQATNIDLDVFAIPPGRLSSVLPQNRAR